MRILITGVAGFIGSHLADRLLGLGHEVVGLDCFTDYYSRWLKDLNADSVRQKGGTVLELDLAQDRLEAALDGVELVYHCAAQPGISHTTPFDDYLRNNIIATRRLARQAMSAPGLKCFVNVSTSSVYGRHAADNEEAAPKPTSHYGVTKLAAEQLVLSYQRESGFPACSLRLFSVYGPRERPEKLYPKLIGCILRDQPFPLYEGSREHSRSFTYVADIVDGFVAVMDNMDACFGEILNIGSDIETTTGRGIDIVEQIIGKKAKIDPHPRRPGDQLRTYANIEKARRVLGYEPTTTPEEGLQAAVDWYREYILNNPMAQA